MLTQKGTYSRKNQPFFSSIFTPDGPDCHWYKCVQCNWGTLFDRT